MYTYRCLAALEELLDSQPVQPGRRVHAGEDLRPGVYVDVIV